MTISFNILPVGAHNWDLCTTKRLQYDDCDPNTILSIFVDNSLNAEDVQIGYIYLTIFNSAGGVRINSFGEDGVDVGTMAIFDPCYLPDCEHVNT